MPARAEPPMGLLDPVQLVVKACVHLNICVDPRLDRCRDPARLCRTLVGNVRKSPLAFCLIRDSLPGATSKPVLAVNCKQIDGCNCKVNRLQPGIPNVAPLFQRVFVNEILVPISTASLPAA